MITTIKAAETYELRADAGGVIHVLPPVGGLAALCGAMTPAFGSRPHTEDTCVVCFIKLEDKEK